jgi:branched-chain amino acid transport system ATP-binding protein
LERDTGSLPASAAPIAAEEGDAPAPMTEPTMVSTKPLDSVEPLLEVRGLSVAYGKRPVLFDVSLNVRPGEIVAVLGHNGAGKTTLLRAIFGLMHPTGGSVHFSGSTITNRAYSRNVKDGISFTPAEAPVFRELTVRDNLALGGFTVPRGPKKEARLGEVLSIFPILRERESQLAGTLSGGQQRMLAVGIALMTQPRLMLLDEPSLGLAPATVQQLLHQIHDLSERDGLSVILVEQNVRAALRVADRAYFIRTGRIILEEDGSTARARDHYWDLF